MDESRLIVFSLAMSSLGLYGAFLPPVSQIAIDYQTPEEKRVLRETEIIGTAHLLLVAIITSCLAHSSLPLLLALLLGASMFATYEYALGRVATQGGQ